MITKREQQTTFASAGFERYSRQTKRGVFLDEMNAIVPWKRLCALIAALSDRRRWATADSVGAHAAHLLSSAVVQFERSRR